jgi:tryptophan aminotransferase
MFLAAAERHLTGKAAWEVPTAGMFLWIKLLLPPPAQGNSGGEGGGDSFEAIRRYARAARVIAVPGTGFMPSGRRSCHIRASYSLVNTPEEAEEACKRIALLVDLVNEAYAVPAAEGGRLERGA